MTNLVAQRDSHHPLKLHQRRDLVAVLELEVALLELGFRHGEQIFNQQPMDDPGRPADGTPHSVDLSFVQPGDLLLQTMRPPMDDIHAGNKRIIHRAYTDVEERIFRAFRPFLGYSARTHMRLGERTHQHVRRGYENRRDMAFKVNGWGGSYDELNDMTGGGWRKWRGGRRTALFLLHLPELWPDGPDVMCAFGMDGCTTSIFAYRLARDLKGMLTRKGFFVFELELGRLPEPPTDLRFCMDWKIEPVLEYDLVDEQRGRARPPAPPPTPRPTPAKATTTPTTPATI